MLVTWIYVHAWRYLIAELTGLQIGWALKKSGWPVRWIKD
jgi:hypothetical protein